MRWVVKVTTDRGSYSLPTYGTKKAAETSAEIARKVPGVTKVEIVSK